MIPVMDTVHISEADLAKDARSILRRVANGAEVVVELDSQPVAILLAANPVRRTISECLALMPSDSSTTLDADFAADVEAAVSADGRNCGVQVGCGLF